MYRRTLMFMKHLLRKRILVDMIAR